VEVSESGQTTASSIPSDDTNGSRESRRLDAQDQQDEFDTASLNPVDKNLHSFWTDSKDVDIDFFVNPYDLPQLEVAERLLGCYMSKVHNSFPILPRKTFEDQFRKCFTALANGNAPHLSPKWQAILNLVFAIGAKYSHVSKANWRADERDHLIYQARARAFAMNDATITGHSDVPQIQSLGLLAFYWLSVGQASR
jgi:hypothetical protein